MSKAGHTASQQQIDDDLQVVDYVSNRLSIDARRAFEVRLAHDTDLSSRVAAERLLAASIQDASPHSIPRAEAFEKIRPHLSGKSKIRRIHAPDKRLLALAASIVFAVAFGSLIPPPISTYEALSSEAAHRVESMLKYQVVFAANTDKQAQQAAAKKFDFDILSGPGTGGAYVVATQRTMKPHELLEWRKDRRIDFAEPLNYSTSP